MGVIADSLRANLRAMAESDARLYRGLADTIAEVSTPRLPISTAQQIAEAIALLEDNGYTVSK